jgi:hypothetical protein
MFVLFSFYPLWSTVRLPYYELTTTHLPPGDALNSSGKKRFEDTKGVFRRGDNLRISF